MLLLSGFDSEDWRTKGYGMSHDDQQRSLTSDASDAKKRGSLSQANRLLDLAAEAELFHTPNMEGYATVFVRDHEETWPLKSKSFKHWLRRQYFVETQSAPSRPALQDAIGVLESRALFEGSTHQVHVRFAEHNGTIYLDLANERWEAVRITSEGWEVTAAPPVKFRRPSGMLALLSPTKNGSVATLRRFLNLASDRQSDWILLVSWLLAAL